MPIATMKSPIGDTACTTPMLELRNLGVSLPGPRGHVDVLADISMTVGRGEIVGIAGESGSGKSMTGKALLNLLPDGALRRGDIVFDGGDLAGHTAKDWRRLRGGEIAMVFQDPTAALHPMLTVGAQLTEHMRIHLGLSKSAARRRAAELLDLVRIPDPHTALRKYPHQFSGGMRQRIAIAIALAAEPRLVIADESTTALDVTVQAGILHLFDRLSREMNLSVMFITHDLGVLAALAHRTYVFYAGRVMESAATADLIAEPRHPYTRALLGARPDAVDAALGHGDLRPIPGTPVTAATAPDGCAFAPRCAKRIDRCTSEVPSPLAIGQPNRPPGDLTAHTAACLLTGPSPEPPITKESSS